MVILFTLISCESRDVEHSSPIAISKNSGNKLSQNIRRNEVGANNPTFREESILIFGELIDENEAPLGNVNIKYVVIRAANMKYSVKNEDFQLGAAITDSSGRFEIREESAMGVELLEFDKPGWTLVPSMARMACSIKDKRDLPGFATERPLVFMMMKEGRVIPKKIKQRVPLTWNGATTHTEIEFAELMINLVGNRERGPGQKHGFDWGTEISIEGGGIQRFQSEGAMLAPTDGYMPTIRYSVNKDDPNWRGEIGSDALWVYRTADGKYGTIELMVYATDDNDHYESLCIIHHNPTGERYLR